MPFRKIGSFLRSGKTIEGDVSVSSSPIRRHSLSPARPKTGARGYRLARLSSTLVEPRGILCIASCSHHMDAASFAEQVQRGMRDSGRSGRILHNSGAGPDHPVHPNLPESAYMTCLFLQLD